MGQSNNGQALPTNQYTIIRELPNGSIVKELNNGRLHFLKQYSFTNQEAYQQAFVNFSKKLPEKHHHILYLERTNTKLQNTFCSTFYKISLLYEYFEHTLQREIEQRSQQRKIFDEKEVWSVLCSCALGVSEMIRVEGRSHAALSAKDIRLNQEGHVKILSLEMIGLDNDHDQSKEGTTKQLAITILNCLLMEEIANDSQQVLLEIVQNLQSTSQMKSILRLMLNSSTKFIELQQYLFRMVQEQTDSLNSFSNTPNLKEKQPKNANSYSKIQEESKEDDSLMFSNKDMEDTNDKIQEQPLTSEQEIPDENDVQQENTKVQDSHRNSLRQRNSQPVSPRKSKCQSPPRNINSHSQQNSLFTDPKLLNLIHSDLQEIKKRKSIAGSRKLGYSESNATLQNKSQSKILQTISNNIQNNFLQNRSNTVQISKSQQQLCDFKLANMSSTNSMANMHTEKEQSSQGSSKVRINSNSFRMNQKEQSKTEINIRNQNSENMTFSKKQGTESCSNPQKKVTEKQYDNIMDNLDMGFKKNKNNSNSINSSISVHSINNITNNNNINHSNNINITSNSSNNLYSSKQKQEIKQDSRVSLNAGSNSDASNTVIFNSKVSSSYNSNTLPLNNVFQSQKSKHSNQPSFASSNRETKPQLQYITQTYIRGRYEGTKLNGMRHGKGVFYYNEGGKYIGEWKENKMNGKGVLYYPNNEIAYDGEWKDDQLWGRGTLYNEDVSQLNGSFDYKNWDQVDQYWIKYEGQFSEDSKNGEGKLYLSNGQIFEGHFKDDMVWGEGILLRRQGTRLKGLWRQNKLVRVF